MKKDKKQKTSEDFDILDLPIFKFLDWEIPPQIFSIICIIINVITLLIVFSK